jgi:uncharacterized protein involved in outer membrane biogenesis
MRRALVILGVLVVAALAALFAVPALTDWDRYRGAIEEEASRLAGREVRIGGRINVRLLPVPYIHIERLRVADTTAAIGEPLFKADAVTVWLSLSPLLGGAIEARRVELTSPILNLVLDENGSGNWASLTSRTSDVRLPGRVTFEDIKISDGALVIREPKGNIKSQFQKIAGTISAAALEGPYRVSLTYAEASDARADGAAHQGSRDLRELRLSTARQDQDGGVRFKGTVRVPTRNQSWAIDATAHELLGRVRIEGSLSARTPFVRSDPVDVRGRSAAAPAMVEIKSSLKADTASAELADLTLTLDADNKPQLAQGAAKFAWGKETSAEILINARWIDVDRILGTDANTASTSTLARVVSGFGDALPGTDKLRALLLLDQATLNGDVISALKLEVQKSGGDGYDIREFSGNLPGSARLVLSGKLTPGAAETEFEGPIALRGASFNRFVAWAGRGRQPPEIARDGPFALDGQLAVGPRRIAGQSIRLELPGGRLGGDASWKFGATTNEAKASAGPVLTLALDGPSFDFGALLPSEPRPGAMLKSLVTSLAFPTTAPRAEATTPPGGLASIDIKLRFGRLATQAAVYHDVDAELAWDGRTWQFPRLKASGGAGWQVELQGGLASTNDADPAGSLAGVILSPDRAALADLLSWLDVPATGLIESQRLDRITPLRLAGRLQLSPKGLPGATRLSIDGSLGESRVSATLTAPKRAATLNAQPLEIDLTGDVPSITTLIAQIAPEGWAAPSASRIAMPARLTLSAVGTLGDGFETLAALDSAGARAELRGRLSAPAGATPELNGTMRLSAEDLSSLVAATALGKSSGLAGVPLAGRIGLKLSDKRLRLDSDDLALADARLRGIVDLDYSKSLTRLDARLTASRVDLSRALIPILDESALAAVTPEARAHTVSWWPEAPFDFDRLDGFEGTIAIDTPEFVIANGVALRSARLESTIKQGNLDIRLVEAAALGGKATARVTLAKAPAGAALKGNVRIDGAELVNTTPDGRMPPLAGRLQLSLDVTGAALTARGLIASLGGSGEVRLTEGVLSQLSSSAIVDASEAVLGPHGTLAPGHLEKAVRERLGAERISLGRRRIPLVVTDGHVRTAPIVAETKAGRVTGTTMIDLDTQRVDSEWKLDGANVAQRPGAKPRGPLPTVTVIWAGPLAKLAALEPQVHVDALERELSVRRMEVEVDELERLRRLDEDRARQETERQRAIDAERQRDAERARESLAAPPPAPGQGQPSSWQPFTTPAAPQPGGAQPPTAGPAGTPAVGTAQGDPAPAPPQQPPPKRKAPPRPQPYNPFSGLWGGN